MMKEIASRYLEAGPDAYRDISSFQRWIVGQFVTLPYTVEFVDHDPYPSLDVMLAEARSTNRLMITTQHNESIFDPFVNLCFRAVHDADHIAFGQSFEIHGERGACRAIVNRCGDRDGQAVLFSEIYAQACVRHVTGHFAPQKLVIFPQGLQERALGL